MLMVLDRSELTVRVNAGVIQVYKDDTLLQRAVCRTCFWQNIVKRRLPSVFVWYWNKHLPNYTRRMHWIRLWGLRGRYRGSGSSY